MGARTGSTHIPPGTGRRCVYATCAPSSRVWVRSSDTYLDIGLAAVEKWQFDVVSSHNTSGGRWNRAGQYSIVLMLWRAPLYLKTILSQSICYPPPPPRYICSIAKVSPYHIFTQRRELIFAALLPIKPVRMLNCSAFAFISRLSDVKQLDGPSGHLLVSQKLKSVSSFVCVKTLEFHFLHSQPLNAAEWSSLVRQLTLLGCFSNQ